MEWTDGLFEATHSGPFGDEMHGHLWHVRVFWPALPVVDSRLMNSKLRAVLDKYDHKTIDPVTNYGLARMIAADLPEVSQVEVWREGRVPCGARYER